VIDIQENSHDRDTHLNLTTVKFGLLRFHLRQKNFQLLYLFGEFHLFFAEPVALMLIAR
jgi:hypothetical protein